MKKEIKLKNYSMKNDFVEVLMDDKLYKIFNLSNDEVCDMYFYTYLDFKNYLKKNENYYIIK